ncbi:hypothetical protein NMY22_g7526 [Coprinellus aureogranulatus]|nr:hypothetical protein NMY22_g7526 [Coprinellus aureogranulatus]
MAGKKLMSRFALLLVHIAILAVLVDASHFHSRGRRSGMHRSIRRADSSLSPNAPPQCQKRNHFKKLREAQAALEGNLPAGQSNATVTLLSGETTVIPVPSSTAEASVSTTSSSSVAESASATSSGKPSSTSSSEAPAKTTSSSSSNAPAPGGILGQLFPVGKPGKSWTTFPEAPNALSLSDATLQPFSILRSVLYKYTNAPDGKHALQAHYAKGSYTFTHTPLGGFSFYAKGPDSVDLTQAKEATFGYRIYFPNGFQFNRGGKLPGLSRCDAQMEAITTTKRPAALEVAVRRGASPLASCGDLTATASSTLTSLPEIPPTRNCAPYLRSRSAMRRMVLPSAVELSITSNGELELWVNGKSVISVKGLVLRVHEAGRIRGVQFQTFFGGSNSDWASPKDQDAYFSDFSLAITESF